MSETTYEFVKDGKVFTRKESELTQEEQDLLLGELIQKWNKSPSIVRNRFIRSGLDAYEDHKEYKNQNKGEGTWFFIGGVFAGILIFTVLRFIL